MPKETPRWKYSETKSFPAGALFWVDKTEDIRQVQPCAKCGKSVLVPWVARNLSSVKCGNCSES